MRNYFKNLFKKEDGCHNCDYLKISDLKENYCIHLDSYDEPYPLKNSYQCELWEIKKKP